MITIKFEIEKDEIIPTFNRIMRNLSNSTMLRFMQTQNRLLIQNVDDQFKRQVYFNDGTAFPWAPLSPTTKRMRQQAGNWYGDGQSTLKKTFRLWDELRRNRVTSAKGNEVYTMLETDDPIALQHQQGIVQGNFGDVPARPVYSMSNTTMDLFTNNFKMYIDKAIRG